MKRAEDAEIRADVRRRVARALVFPDTCTEMLRTVHPEGYRPIVVALPTDSVESVMKQAHDEHDGFANIVVPYKGVLCVLGTDPAKAPAELRHSQPVAPCSEMGMLIDLLAQQPSGAIVVHLKDPGTDVAVHSAEKLLIPA